jgi:glutamine amidotransferase
VFIVATDRDQSEYRPRIAVVDFGAGNLRSVSHALQVVGAEALVTDRAEDITAADAVVFPGDGAARSAMEGLVERDLVGPVREAVRSGRPFLGVCLGMQVLMTGSDEDGGVECLGIIPGNVVRLQGEHKIPHMGWNQVRQRRYHRLFDDVPDLADFYFVHSYVVVPDDSSEIIGETEYGGAFASVISRGNVVATQYHPEKSATAGLRLYRNFTRWVADTMTGARAAVEYV